MIKVLFNDLTQRIVTLDKLQQRQHLAQKLQNLDLPKNSKSLDFGCGTGLFARTFFKAGLTYYGYDIDKDFLAYATKLYPTGNFSSNLDVISQSGPFDVILANCCFHHISDDELQSSTLVNIKQLMTEHSRFIFVDLLQDNNASFIRRMFNKLERGVYLRSKKHWEAIISNHFVINNRYILRTYSVSLVTRYNPLYNDVIVFDLTLSDHVSKT